MSLFEIKSYKKIEPWFETLFWSPPTVSVHFVYKKFGWSGNFLYEMLERGAKDNVGALMQK